MARPRRNKVGFNLQIDRDLLERVKRMAEEEGRTYSSEVEMAVKRHVSALERREQRREPMAASA